MTKDQWQEIKNKYPKAFSLFREYTIKLGFVEIERDSLFICYPFLLFGIFERFFDSVGIDLLSMLYQLKCDAEFFKIEYIQDIAKIEITIKAFEILNTMIEKGEIK